MPDENVIKNKLAAMGQYYQELLPYLELYRKGELGLHDMQIFIVERLFQLIADAAIDINTHIMTRSSFEPSDDYEGTFRVLGNHKVIPLELGEKMSGSIGLRNRMVHGYENVQRKRMMDDISNGIQQYAEYMKHINDFLESNRSRRA